MKTDDLLRVLAADRGVRPMPPRLALALALIPSVAIALAIHFPILGLRPHLFPLLGEPRLLFKLCLTVLLAALSDALVARRVYGENETIEIAKGEPLRRFSSQRIELVAQRHDLRLERGS